MRRVPPRPQLDPLVSPGGVEHHVRDMTATFAADVTLAAAQAQLAPHGQWLPIDGAPDATLGRLIETNSTGPLRLGYGAWRDLLLGCQFLNGAGELITAGGRTVKNVAGYDLTKFMVGQHGIFGRVVTLTTRTYRKPQFALRATFEPDVRRLSALLTTSARPQWAVLSARELICGYLGDQQFIAFQQRELPRYQPSETRPHTTEDDETLRRSLWTKRPSENEVGLRASVPPTSIESFTTEAQLTDWSADAAFGVVVGTCPASRRATIEQAVTGAGGTVLFFDESGQPLRVEVDVPLNKLLHRLKRAFDPRSQLDPLPLDSR
jgi:glycolate oxidase FAD binding subunit